MLLPGREWQEGYRFGFSAQEIADESNGSGMIIDFKFRIYNTRIGKWVSVDQLIKRYPSLSPYSFVDNNPIWFEEMDGRYFDFSNLSSEQKETYNTAISLLRENSQLFNYMYSRIEASSNAYVVKFGETSGTNPAEFIPNTDEKGGEIIYSANTTLNMIYTIEENFHVFQIANKNLFYSQNVALSNIEFESKLYVLLVELEGGFLYGGLGGTEEFSDYVLQLNNYNLPTSELLASNEFQEKYDEYLSTFVNYWREAVPDPNTFPGYKTTPTLDDPSAVDKIIREVEAKNLSGPRLENGDYYDD